MSMDSDFDAMPNAGTLAAMAEGEDAIAHPEKYRWYDDVDVKFREIIERPEGTRMSLTDSLIGILKGNYDYDTVRTQALEEKYNVHV